MGGGGGRGDGSLSLEVRLPRGWTLVKQKHTTLTDISGQTPTTRADCFGPRAFCGRKKKRGQRQKKPLSVCVRFVSVGRVPTSGPGSWQRTEKQRKQKLTDAKMLSLRVSAAVRLSSFTMCAILLWKIQLYFIFIFLGM